MGLHFGKIIFVIECFIGNVSIIELSDISSFAEQQKCHLWMQVVLLRSKGNCESISDTACSAVKRYLLPPRQNWVIKILFLKDGYSIKGKCYPNLPVCKGLYLATRHVFWSSLLWSMVWTGTHWRFPSRNDGLRKDEASQPQIPHFDLATGFSEPFGGGLAAVFPAFWVLWPSDLMVRHCPCGFSDAEQVSLVQPVSAEWKSESPTRNTDVFKQPGWWTCRFLQTNQCSFSAPLIFPQQSQTQTSVGGCTLNLWPSRRKSLGESGQTVVTELF